MIEVLSYGVFLFLLCPRFYFNIDKLFGDTSQNINFSCLATTLKNVTNLITFQKFHIQTQLQLDNKKQSYLYQCTHNFEVLTYSPFSANTYF